MSHHDDEMTLPDLARAINQADHVARHAMQASLLHARECGSMLLDAKSRVGRGGWLKWVATFLHFTDRHARRYMEIARRWEELAPVAGSGMTMKEANRLLSGEDDAEDEEDDESDTVSDSDEEEDLDDEDLSERAAQAVDQDAADRAAERQEEEARRMVRAFSNVCKAVKVWTSAGLDLQSMAALLAKAAETVKRERDEAARRREAKKAG